MTDFDYDVMQKKRLAASARHVVNGSRSKYCSLPSDNLTAAELKRRNGPVITYNLSVPMSWNTYKTMPDDIRRSYLEGLRDKYHVSLRNIGSMCGVSGYTAAVEAKRLGVHFPQHSRMEASEKAAWEVFLTGAAPIITATPPEPKKENPVKAEPVKIAEKKPEPAVRTISGSMELSGCARDVMEQMAQMLGTQLISATITWRPEAASVG